jgi:proline dehydrogenase
VLSRALARVLPLLPRRVVWWVARRYIAGERLEDAAATVRQLNAGGKIATVDVLGEALSHVDETHEIVAEYRSVLAAFDAGGLDSSVSVKLTALGLELDLDLAREHLEAIVRDAAGRGRFVRIDMEDSSTTDDTLRLYRELRGKGLDNVGIVLQACLRRTQADIAALRELVPNVRIVKGIYIEPEAIAYRDFHEVRAQFLQAVDALLAGGSFVALATHDEHLIVESLRRTAALDADRYEFQMLLGVRPERGDRLVADGERLRIYVPYGKHWYEYSLRRLQENPQLAGHIARDTLRRLTRRSVSRKT